MRACMTFAMAGRYEHHDAICLLKTNDRQNEDME